MRWSEEVMLLQEEMRRVLEYMSWLANWWTSHTVVPSNDHDLYLSEGLTAYATKQANIRLSLRNHFGMLWTDVKSWLDENKVPNLESTFEHDYDDA